MNGYSLLWTGFGEVLANELCLNVGEDPELVIAIKTGTDSNFGMKNKTNKNKHTIKCQFIFALP
jgi:hypothetical protein